MFRPKILNNDSQSPLQSFWVSWHIMKTISKSWKYRQTRRITKIDISIKGFANARIAINFKLDTIVTKVLA
jgi:hypothetical protein